MGIPLHLHEVNMGFSNLVNKYGADDKPKGKTVNWKYLTTPSPKSQEKAKYFWCSGKNFDVMISRLKVKSEKIKPFKEDLNG